MPWTRPAGDGPQSNVDRTVQLAHERSERVRRIAARLLSAPDARAMLALDKEFPSADSR